MTERRAAYRTSKYNAKKTEVDGYLFDSRAEARRYQELKILEQAGEITALELQPKFSVYVNRQHICNYKADFRYLTRTGECVTEDVKGVKTAVYRLKKKLVEASYGIEITEVSA